MERNQPLLLVIAGSNGAGKSTYSKLFLPDEMRDVDVWDFDIQFYEFKKLAIKQGLSPKEATIKAEEKVSALFNERRRACMQKKFSFAYEGHFTGGAQWQPLLEAKQQGFYVHMIFLGLPSVEKSMERVRARVKAGGHYVNEQNIKINFYGNMDMLDRNLKLPDQIDIYEAGKKIYPAKICTIINGIVVASLPVIPGWIKNEMPELKAAIEAYYSK